MLVGMSVNERFGDSHKSNANFSVFRIMKQGLDIADSLKKMGKKVNLTCGAKPWEEFTQLSQHTE